MWSALVLFIAPGFGDVRSHNSQTVAFAHFDSSTIWTAMPLGSDCNLCIPVMRIVSCSLRTNPSTNFVAIWLDEDIVKMLVLVIVPFLPQPWRQQAEIWPLLLGKAAPHWLAAGSHNRYCSIRANTDVHIRRKCAQGPGNSFNKGTCCKLQGIMVRSSILSPRM